VATFAEDSVSALHERRPRPPLDFRVAIRTPAREGEPSELLDEGHWSVRSVQIEEELHAPYVATLTLVTEDTLLEVDRLVGGEIELDVARLGLSEIAHDDARRLHGVVLRAEYLGTHSRRAFVRVVVGPALSLLSFTKRSRIFQNENVVAIANAVVAEVFATRQRELVVDRLLAQYPAIDYCVQHRETDLEFLQRVLAEAGITYVWDHEGDREAMILVDSNETFAPLGQRVGEGGLPTIVDVLTSETHGQVSGLSQFGWARSVRTRKHEVRAWDWKAAPPTALSNESEAATAEPWEIGDAHLHDIQRACEAESSLVDDTIGLAERAAAVAGVESGVARGRGTLLAMSAGATIEVDGHPNPHLQRAYLVTRVVHRAEIPAADMHASGTSTYHNEIEAVPLEQPWRPRRRAKPRIQGPQLATVVGPQGEDIHTDTHGRVKVCMHWDREGLAPDLSCWMRVAQAWAGPGYGTFFLPRVGMEVVIAFIDGDPDQPLVTGCVYNGGNPAPVELPDQKTRSTIRTRSSPPNGGFNELRFEDAAGKEEIYVHAQRNLREAVRSAQSTSVGATCSLSVGKTYTRSVGTGETIYVGKGDTPAGDPAAPEGSREVHVDGLQAHHIKDVATLEAKSVWHAGAEVLNLSGGQTVWLSRGGSSAIDARPATPLVELVEDIVRIQAGDRIELLVGSTRLIMTQQGIVLEAPTFVMSKVGESKLEVRELEIRAESDNISATGGKNSVVTLMKDEAKLETATAKIVTTAETNVDAGPKLVMKAAEANIEATAVKIAGTDVKIDGTTVSVVAKGPHVIQGLPVKIN
jgi:type VI secretion system secreted protein VgrG